jgi:hypothetical protein
MKEQIKILSGKWQDTYYRTNGQVEKTEVNHNQIQDNAYVAIASLLMNQFDVANVPVETPTTFGISHIDYGSGDPTWDLVENQPVPQPTAQTTLHNATYRQAINQSQINFVPDNDPFGGSATSLTPTSRIRINLTITEQEFQGDLREFGLFCRYNDNANVADQVNEGLIFNWVIHPLISKDDTLRIERVIEITISKC